MKPSDWLSPTVARRYRSKVDRRRPEDCWPWLGHRTKAGYGSIATGTLAQPQKTLAHRIAWVLVFGSIDDDLTIDHLCFNRWCQNPNHMDLVSRSVNGARGAIRRGKVAIDGEVNGAAKLTDEAVRAIRSEYVPRKVPLRVFAERYGTSIQTIQYVVAGLSWRHVR